MPPSRILKNGSGPGGDSGVTSDKDLPRCCLATCGPLGCPGGWVVPSGLGRRPGLWRPATYDLRRSLEASSSPLPAPSAPIKTRMESTPWLAPVLAPLPRGSGLSRRPSGTAGQGPRPSPGAAAKAAGGGRDLAAGPLALCWRLSTFSGVSGGLLGSKPERGPGRAGAAGCLGALWAERSGGEAAPRPARRGKGGGWEGARAGARALPGQRLAAPDLRREPRAHDGGAMAALLLLPLLLLPLLLLAWKLHLGPRLRWFAADFAFALRALRCKRALRKRALAAAAADPGGPEGGCSLAWRLAQLARERPAHVFLIHGARRFSYAEAERESNRAARAFLRARGRDAGLGGGAEAEQAAAPLAPGATVALLLPACPEFLWLWFGLAKAGLRTAFVPAALRRGPLLHCLRSCGARALVLAPEFLESLEPDLPALRAMGLRLWAVGPEAHRVGISDFLAEASAEVDEPVPGYLSAPQSIMDTCLYIFTSGTTGLPKAARISHLKVLQCQGFYQLCGALPEDVIYLALPLYHMSGSLLGIVGCLGIGATVVLKSKFSAGQFWEDCQQHRVTVFQYIGELCRYLVNQPPSKAERGHKVRLAVGSGLRPDTWERFVRRFGPVQVLETYGLTEGNIATFNYTGELGAVGRASWLYKHVFPFSLIRYDVTTGKPIRDAQGHCVATCPGEPGLLVAPVSQQSPFLGYAGGPELALGKLLKNVFRPGDVFFNTGDLLVCDDQGFLRFHDRTGDTFRWKGENVATTEVAEALEGLDFLQEVNVYGVTVPGHEGRAGMAALVLRAPQPLDLAQLYAHVSENLPPYAWPRFLRLQESLATTETFKQQKMRMTKEGFNPNALSDPLYILDQAGGAYLPLTPARYRALLAGELRI